jgi:hypothetical protein
MSAPHEDAAWAWWDRLGAPSRVCGPMVLQSELAFRLLVRAHGVELCYTPMIVAADLLAAVDVLGSEDAALDAFYDGGARRTRAGSASQVESSRVESSRVDAGARVSTPAAQATSLTSSSSSSSAARAES